MWVVWAFALLVIIMMFICLLDFICFLTFKIWLLYLNNMLACYIIQLITCFYFKISTDKVNSVSITPSPPYPPVHPYPIFTLCLDRSVTCAHPCQMKQNQPTNPKPVDELHQLGSKHFSWWCNNSDTWIAQAPYYEWSPLEFDGFSFRESGWEAGFWIIHDLAPLGGFGLPCLWAGGVFVSYDEPTCVKSSPSHSAERLVWWFIGTSAPAFTWEATAVTAAAAEEPHPDWGTWNWTLKRSCIWFWPTGVRMECPANSSLCIQHGMPPLDPEEVISWCILGG